MGVATNMTFHWYGFIVGLAVSIVLWGMEYLVRRSDHKAKISLSNGQIIAVLIIILIGARLWHVVTDWQLYGQLSWEIFAVWQGGLSILGAILAGMLGIWWLVPNKSQRQWLIDALVLWLPIGQAVGRCANWVNQELYGLPTTQPWGMYISSEHRLSGFEKFSFFHPLFLYEAIGLLVLAAILWYLHSKKSWQLGEGKLGLLYVAGYSWLRFWLDFLRVDRSIEWQGLGINQWVLALLGLGLLSWYVYKNRAHYLRWSRMLGVGVLIAVIGLASVWMSRLRVMWLESLTQPVQLRDQAISRTLLNIPDRTVQTFIRNNVPLRLVVVNTDASRQQGLSHTQQPPEQGMLFVFNRPAQHVFWMKDMAYPLDFIWFREGRVIDLHTQVRVPPAGSVDAQLPRYAPREPADMMLEVPAGTVEKDNWQIGDVLQLVFEREP